MGKAGSTLTPKKKRKKTGLMQGSGLCCGIERERQNLQPHSLFLELVPGWENDLSQERIIFFNYPREGRHCLLVMFFPEQLI